MHTRNNNELFSAGLGLCDRKYGKISREEFIASISKNSKILELGPYYCPALVGNNIKYFDVLDERQLTEKAIRENVDISKIPEITYVEPNGDLSIIKEKFDLVFSSHNIEHQVDLVTHLKKVAELIKEGGSFHLIIPDKRYCFDHYFPETPYSEVLDSYISGSSTKFHSLRTLLSMRCEATHNDPVRHWQGDSGLISAAKGLEGYSSAIEEFKLASQSGGYIDLHRWRFTPSSFEFIANALYKGGYISLQIESVYDTLVNTQEFFAVLRKS